MRIRCYKCKNLRSTKRWKARDDQAVHDYCDQCFEKTMRAEAEAGDAEQDRQRSISSGSSLAGAAEKAPRIHGINAAKFTTECSAGMRRIGVHMCGPGERKRGGDE